MRRCIECCTHIAVSKGRTLSRVYARGLTTARGALTRSEAETDPEDPRLAACWAANLDSIWAMVASTSVITNARLMKVSRRHGKH